jgi:hypothetical protein
MRRMPHHIGGRGEKPAGLPEPAPFNMFEHFRCMLRTFANVEGNCFGERPDLIDSLLAESPDEVNGQG